MLSPIDAPLSSSFFWLLALPSPLLCQHISSRPVNTNTDSYPVSHRNRCILRIRPLFYSIVLTYFTSCWPWIGIPISFFNTFRNVKYLITSKEVKLGWKQWWRVLGFGSLQRIKSIAPKRVKVLFLLARLFQWQNILTNFFPMYMKMIELLYLRYTFFSSWGI